MLSAEIQPDGQPANSPHRQHLALAVAGEAQVFEWIHRDSTGGTFPLRSAPGAPGGRRGAAAGAATITDYLRAQARRDHHGKRARFLRAARPPMPACRAVLDVISALVQAVYPRSRCTISVLSPDASCFALTIARQLPPMLAAVLERTPIEPRRGFLRRRGLLGLRCHGRGCHPRCALGGSPPGGARCRISRGLVHAHQGRQRQVVRLGGDLPPGTGPARLARTGTAVTCGALAALAIERNLAEEALRTSEAKFRGLFEGVIEGVYQSTRDGRLVSVNSAFVKMLGYGSAEEMYALPSSVMLYWSAPDRADFVRRVDSDGEVRSMEVMLRRRRWHAGGGAGEFTWRARWRRPHRRLRRLGVRHHRAQTCRAGDSCREGSRARHAAIHRRRGDHHRRQRPDRLSQSGGRAAHGMDLGRGTRLRHRRSAAADR